jgi:hypothetical protein
MPSEFFTFGVIGTTIVLIVGHLVRLRRTSIFHKTLRDAISRNHEALPGLLSDGLEPAPARPDDARNALLLIALALAMVAFGLIQGDPDDIRNLAGGAVFPGFVGIALLVRERWFKPRD